MIRKKFPTSGIYACSSLASSDYMTKEDERRYRYITPAYGEDSRDCFMADCWIVDKHGNVNPGTNVSPVPVRLSSIGRKVG
jgi:hypothetical protein